MRKEEKFNNILNECLDRILKGETVEQCLLRYPDQAQELEPLLKTAKTARVISTVQPSPEYRVAAKRQFMAALIERQVKQNEGKTHSSRRIQWRWQSGWAIALVAVVIVVLGGGGTIAAASGSMPDSGLYPVKLATEQVQLALAPGQLAETKLNAEFADRRVEEIIYTAEKGDEQDIQIAAVRLNTNLANISELAAGKSQTKVENFDGPSLMATPSPEVSKNAAPPLMNSITEITPMITPEISAPIEITEPVTLVGIEDTSAAAQSTERWAGPDSVKVSLTKYEKMAQIIQENYEKRKLKLEQALQNASPKALPAIQQAITQSDLEYERAMENLAERQAAE
jgi:hypothetical protein